MQRAVRLFFIMLCAFGVLLAVALGAAFVDMFLPAFTAMRLSGGKGLGGEEICASLLKGDYKAASEPIGQKTATRELRFAETVTWLARKSASPYAAVPASQLFTELPQDQGPLLSCAAPALYNLSGNRLSSTLDLRYEKSRVAVTLRYSAGLFSQKLQTIEIGAPAPLHPGEAPPGVDERRMAEFARQLDKRSGK